MCGLGRHKADLPLAFEEDFMLACGTVTTLQLSTKWPKRSRERERGLHSKKPDRISPSEASKNNVAGIVGIDFRRDSNLRLTQPYNKLWIIYIGCVLGVCIDTNLSQKAAWLCLGLCTWWFCHIMEDYDREWLSTALWLRRDLFKGDQKSSFVKWCTCSTSCVPGSPCLSTWKCHPVTFWNAVFQQNSVLALLAEHCSEIDVGQHEIEQLLCYIADTTTLCSETSRFISVVVLDWF